MFLLKKNSLFHYYWPKGSKVTVVAPYIFGVTHEGQGEEVEAWKMYDRLVYIGPVEKRTVLSCAAWMIDVSFYLGAPAFFFLLDSGMEVLTIKENIVPHSGIILDMFGERLQKERNEHN